MKTRRAFKLFRLRNDGTLGSLFICRKRVLPMGVWMEAEDHKTKGYSHRPGWHVLPTPKAPHLSEKGRVWCVVDIQDYKELERPEDQGGLWLLANRMIIRGFFNYV